MTKKDEKDADRPHYYSQFWLDVAAGRKVIGGPKLEDGSDQADIDLAEPIPLVRKGGRVNPNILPADGYREARATAIADGAYDEDENEDEEGDEDTEEFSQPEDEEPDTVEEVSDADIPTIVDDTPEEMTPDIEPEAAEEEEAEAEGKSEEEEEFYDEEEEDEEEWPARGRKKPKPGRQVKAPKAPAKKPKRGGGRY